MTTPISATLKIFPLLFAILVMTAGCISSAVVEEDIDAVAQTLDYGDYTSATLATKAWEALNGGDDTKALAYTSKCIELYGERGKEMNAQLTGFAPVERVNNYWALNDAGTCMYIAATVYEKRRMYPQAAKAYRSLADDYTYSQCWDPQGWYWHPASGAAAKARKYEYK